MLPVVDGEVREVVVPLVGFDVAKLRGELLAGIKFDLLYLAVVSVRGRVDGLEVVRRRCVSGYHSGTSSILDRRDVTGMLPDGGRQAVVVPRWRQRGIGPCLNLVAVIGAPLWPMVDVVLADHEPAVQAVRLSLLAFKVAYHS